LACKTATRSGKREREAGSGKQGAGSREREAGSGKQGAGSWEQEAGSGKRQNRKKRGGGIFA